MQTNTVAGRWGAVVLFLTLAVTLGFLVLASASPVEAAKGGNGKGNSGHTSDSNNGNGNGNGHKSDGDSSGGGGGGGQSSGSVSVAGPVYAHDSMTIVGSGFSPGETVAIKIEENWCCIWGSVVADGSGSFAVTTITREPGTYRIWAGSAYTEVAVLPAP